MREACALRHFSIKTEKTYVYWLRRYGIFLKDPRFTASTTEQKMEAFLTRLAHEGVAATTQNQAFNAALFFYRDVLKQEVGQVNSLRAKRAGNPRHCPTQEEVRRLLAAVSNIYSYPTRLKGSVRQLTILGLTIQIPH
jgi:site-specific recombinase XerD